MKLIEIWKDLSNPLQKVFKFLSGQRVDTDRLLEGLAGINSTQNSIEVVSEIADDLGLEKIHSDDENIDYSCPDNIDLSSDVREALDFFRIHKISKITTARLILRLLQIGSGSSVRKLEREGSLQAYRDKLRREVNS